MHRPAVHYEGRSKRHHEVEFCTTWVKFANIPKKKDLRVMGTTPHGWEYYGVEFLPEECAHILDHTRMGPLIDDHQCRWPLLKK